MTCAFFQCLKSNGHKSSILPFLQNFTTLYLYCASKSNDIQNTSRGWPYYALLKIIIFNLCFLVITSSIIAVFSQSSIAIDYCLRVVHMLHRAKHLLNIQLTIDSNLGSMGSSSYLHSYLFTLRLV